MDQSPTNDLQDRCETVVEEASLLREKLKTAERRHQLLAREASYRVASNLQLLTASLFHHQQRASSAPVREFAQHVIVQVQAVARVHERFACLDGKPGTLELAPFVREVCTDLAIIWGVPDVNLEFDTQPVTIGANQAASLALITSELVANAYRHAFTRQRAGSIRLHLKPMTPETTILAVADTGGGLGADVVKGAGLTAVEMLARSIGGDVRYSRGPGARVDIAFPNVAAAARVLDL